ncbi:MAG TPA: zinc ribbon domain-containing protein [Acidimicrobiia bacterium]|nr:zinc ribbon domain-containing protein [Acidimicrobiia bacterium]
MKTTEGQPVLPPEFNLPRAVTEIEGRDGETYLEFTTHMVTFYRQTYGEHSRFFMALRDGRLIGAHCSRCEQVMVPAATWRCPNCDFAEMTEIELPHRGVLAQTAPITIFPSASFLGEAPFARGYVDVATEAPIASFLPSRLRTTTGLERPGIFVKGVELKLVFEDQREGSIRDIFWVPLAEVPEELRGKEPLLASELDFSTPEPPAVLRDAAKADALGEAIAAMRRLADQVARSRRAQADLAGRQHVVGVTTGGGDFTISVGDSKLAIAEGIASGCEYTLVVDDPAVFTRWVRDGSLTDAAVEGTLWLPHREAFQLLPILDRLPRSTRRDLGDAVG